MLSEKKPFKISIWFLVGIILALYGLVITITGFYYLKNPASVALSQDNPSLWWGVIMLVFGLIMVFGNLRKSKET